MTTCQRCDQTIVPAPKYPNHPWLHEHTRLLTCSNGYNRDFATPANEASIHSRTGEDKS